MAINQDKLNEFLQRAVVDFGAVFHAAVVWIGDKLGLYKKLAELGPTSSADLAKATGTAERYVREWLASQSAGGYVTYHPVKNQYFLTEEQAFGLADENSPAFLPGAFEVALAAVKAEFGKFGETLSAVKEKIDQASRKMEDVDVRSRVITKKLRDVEELPSNPQPMLRDLSPGENDEGLA